jgi:hypothetical protein
VKVVLQEKIFRNRQSRNKNCLRRPCLLTDRDEIINLYTTDTDRSASYLDIHIYLKIDNEGRLRKKHYNKKDYFNFPIVNFPFICSNNPAESAIGVFISQLIRYLRVCGSYQDFLDRGLLLTRKLPSQEFLLIKLESSLRKFYGRHHDLVNRSGLSVSQMTTDLFHLS